MERQPRMTSAVATVRRWRFRAGPVGPGFISGVATRWSRGDDLVFFPVDLFQTLDSAAPMPPPWPSSRQMRTGSPLIEPIFAAVCGTRFRHHAGDIAAVHALLEDAGAQEYPRRPVMRNTSSSSVPAPVHHGQLKFVLEIGDGPEPGGWPAFCLRGILDQQAVKVSMETAGNPPGTPGSFHAFLDGKQDFFKALVAPTMIRQDLQSRWIRSRWHW